MDSEKLKGYYSARKDDFLQQERFWSRRSSWVGWGRFFVFLAILYVSYLNLTLQGETLLIVLWVLCLVAFALLLKWHVHIQYRRKYFGKLVEINQNEWEVQELGNNLFGDGSIYHSQERYYDDLDLFGSKSLYAYVNRCSTESGKKQLALHFKNLCQDKDLILDWQAAIKELGNRIDFKQSLAAEALVAGHLDESVLFTTDELLTAKRKPGWIHWGWLTLMALSVVLWILTGWYQITISLGIIGLLIVGAHGKYTQQNQLLVSGKAKKWKAYSRLFSQIQKGTFQSSVLLSLQSQIDSAAGASERLGLISDWYDRRLNLFAFIF